jgi:hypothetical protein
VKLLNNPKLAQNVLKRLNKENETELEPLNPGQPKLLNDKRAYNVTEREPLNPGQPKLLNNDKRAYNKAEREPLNPGQSTEPLPRERVCIFASKQR